MSELLLRLFVYRKGADDGRVHTRCGLLSGITGIILNVLLVAGKLTVGIIAGSVAIIADAINNLSDAASSVITLVGFKLAGHKPDKEHPFGHGRIEYVAGMIVSVLIIFMGFELAWSSIEKIITPEAATFSYAAAGVLVAAILVKLWMFYFNMKIAKRIDSPSIRATATDSISDVIATGVVLIALIAGQYTSFPIDGVAGVIVALFIFKAGWGAVKTTQAPLIGRPMKRELADKISELALAHENIMGVHDFIYHDYGAGRSVLSFHAEVPAALTLTEAHAAIDHLEREIREKFGIDAVIHMDPVSADGDTGALLEFIEAAAREIDPAITVHDLQTAVCGERRDVFFDVTAPYGLSVTDEEIERRLKEALENRDRHFNATIRIDHPFIEG